MIKLGNNVVNPSDITNIDVFEFQIPYGNEFNVDQTKVVTLKNEVGDIEFLVYQNGSRTGDLIENMVNCAMEGKQRFRNCMPSNGLEIFQNFYDKYYDSYVWVGVNKPLTELFEQIRSEM